MARTVAHAGRQNRRNDLAFFVRNRGRETRRSGCRIIPDRASVKSGLAAVHAPGCRIERARVHALTESHFDAGKRRYVDLVLPRRGGSYADLRQHRRRKYDAEPANHRKYKGRGYSRGKFKSKIHVGSSSFWISILKLSALSAHSAVTTNPTYAGRCEISSCCLSC